MPVTARQIFARLEEIFPVRLAEDWDNTGLQLGNPNKSVKKVLVSLDADRETVAVGIREDADLVITHHPLLFNPVKQLDFSQPQAGLLQQLVAKDIAVYSLHTNLDTAPGGLNQYLAERLGLEDIVPWGTGRFEPLYKLVVYVPRDHVEDVRRAICAGGAGHIGNYSDCSFRVAGTGTFRPLEGTNPYLGEVGRVAEVEEFRLETVVPESRVSEVLSSMRKSHPYEEIAYDLIRLSNKGQRLSPARKGRLANPVSLAEFARRVKERLKLGYVSVVGDLQAEIRKVAVVSGSGASFIKRAAHENVDVLVTGDVRYHEAREAQILGINVVDAGHYGTEHLAVELLAQVLQEESESRQWDVEIIRHLSGSPFVSV